MTIEPVRVPKASELVANRLRRLIVGGGLAPGDTLPPEAALTEEFGISRPTLREAFRVLESEQLISVARGAKGGARVQSPSATAAARSAGLVLEHEGTTLADVYAARVIIEAPCASMLAERRTDADLSLLTGSVEEAEAFLDDRHRLIRHHTEFHALVVALAGNNTIRLMSSMVRHIIDTANFRRVDFDAHGAATDRAFAHGVRAHRRLVEYIEAGDVERAGRLWRKHLEEANAFLLDLPGTITILDLLD